jgi:hypothetical protein
MIFAIVFAEIRALNYSKAKCLHQGTADRADAVFLARPKICGIISGSKDPQWTNARRKKFRGERLTGR